MGKKLSNGERKHGGLVAQIFNLLYRRFATCTGRVARQVRLRVSHGLPIANRRYGRVQLCATRDYAPQFGNRRGFTVVELMVVVACVALLAALILPVVVHFDHPYPQVLRSNCRNNLKQVGLSFRIWSVDNNGLYPMQYYTNESGGFKFADETNGFRYFQAMSNELSTPKVVHCPEDTGRTSATNFVTDFGNTNVSYFIGLDADAAHPSMFLAGDRNIANGTAVKNGVLLLTMNPPVRWAKRMNRDGGNVGLADGSAQWLDNSALRSALSATGTNVTRLLMP